MGEREREREGGDRDGERERRGLVESWEREREKWETENVKAVIPILTFCPC